MLRIRLMNSRRCALIFVFTVLLLVLTSCTRNANKTDGAVFVVAVVDEQFRVLLTEPQQIREARLLLNGAENKIVMGDLARGDGGFNQGYGWHLTPESVGFYDVTIELCDGRPSYVEEDLEYWLEAVKAYCPWSSRVVREEAF